ncbi:hypothetical protein M3Y94_01318400 [Aphelenchoides besseyi]|nr:hypothetical protein M3Y94_01318400 [Aphelenchoides besseyi]KAI6216609.1 Major sperm protein [Aphelenchoides besseyi]
MICDSASDLNNTMVGRQSNGVTTTRNGQIKETNGRGLFSRLNSTSRQDFSLFAGGLIGLYCLSGDHSMLICNFCSSAPATFFTYRVINEDNTPVSSMKAILGFWILFAMFVPMDYVFGRVVGYFTAKFLLLIAALGHVCSKCKFDEVDETPLANSKTVDGMNETHERGDFRRLEHCSAAVKKTPTAVGCTNVRRCEKTAATLTSAISDFEETEGRGMSSTMRDYEKNPRRELAFESSVAMILEEKSEDEDLCSSCNLLVHGSVI